MCIYVYICIHIYPQTYKVLYSYANIHNHSFSVVTFSFPPLSVLLSLFLPLAHAHTQTLIQRHPLRHTHTYKQICTYAYAWASYKRCVFVCVRVSLPFFVLKKILQTSPHFSRNFAELLLIRRFCLQSVLIRLRYVSSNCSVCLYATSNHSKSYFFQCVCVCARACVCVRERETNTCHPRAAYVCMQHRNHWKRSVFFSNKSSYMCMYICTYMYVYIFMYI